MSGTIIGRGLGLQVVHQLVELRLVDPAAKPPAKEA